MSMEPLPDDLRGHIDAWRNTLASDPLPDNVGIIARLYLTLNPLYKELLLRLQKRKDIPRPLYRKLERGQSSLALWSCGNGVTEGKVDKALERSQDMRDANLRLLVNICTIIITRLFFIVQDQGDDGKLGLLRLELMRASSAAEGFLHSQPQDEKGVAASQRSPRPSSDTVEKIASNIKTLTQALADLGPSIGGVDSGDTDSDEARESRGTEAEAVAEPSISIPAPHLVSLILFVFPKCDRTTAEGIARALWQNWKSLRASEGETETGITPGADSESPRPQEAVDADQCTSTNQTKETTITESLFADSAVGTSIATGSSYAETVRAYLGNSDSPVKIELPKLPREAKGGKAIKCNTCNKMIKVASERSWKQHVMADVKPYMCIEPQCAVNYRPFQTKAAWARHISKHYAPGADIRCPICGIEYPVQVRTSLQIISHLSHHLEALAAEALVPDVTFVERTEGSDGGEDVGGSEDSVRDDVSQHKPNAWKPAWDAISDPKGTKRNWDTVSQPSWKAAPRGSDTDRESPSPGPEKVEIPVDAPSPHNPVPESLLGQGPSARALEKRPMSNSPLNSAQRREDNGGTPVSPRAIVATPRMTQASPPPGMMASNSQMGQHMMMNTRNMQQQMQQDPNLIRAQISQRQRAIPQSQMPHGMQNGIMNSQFANGQQLTEHQINIEMQRRATMQQQQQQQQLQGNTMTPQHQMAQRYAQLQNLQNTQIGGQISPQMQTQLQAQLQQEIGNNIQQPIVNPNIAQNINMQQAMLLQQQQQQQAQQQNNFATQIRVHSQILFNKGIQDLAKQWGGAAENIPPDHMDAFKKHCMMQAKSNVNNMIQQRRAVMQQAAMMQHRQQQQQQASTQGMGGMMGQGPHGM